MAPAAWLRSAAPRALLLPMLLLLLQPPPLLARALPPVSARHSPGAPRRRGAGHAGWAQRQIRTQGGAPGGLLRLVPETVSGSL